MKKPIALALLAAVSLCGAPSLLEDAYEAFYNLDYDRALADYQKALAADPDTPELHNYIAQTLLYREMYRNGALESQLVSGNNSFIRRAKLEPSPEVEKRFFAEVEMAMALCQTRIENDPKDTQALHTLAISYGLRANYGFLVRKTWSASLSDSAKARKYDQAVTEIDPTNYDARLIQGGYDYIVGSLSWSMRALGFIAGFRGDKERGLRTIEEVALKGKENRVDAEIILCALYRREGWIERSIPLVRDLIHRFPRNYLLRFELAQMYGASGLREESIGTLNEIAALKSAHSKGYDRVSWEKIHYETGNLQFWFDDFDNALDNLKKATSKPSQLKELDLNSGALAFMRQGQIYDLKNRHDLAIQAYRQAMEFAPEADAAKESQKYIGSPYKRG